MEMNDELDIDKIVQYELDTLIFDDTIDDFVDNDDDVEHDRNEIEDEEIINDTRQNLERDMHERLAAFENEIKANLHRFEIDYSEIDELLQKPSGENENDIQRNVARECGIEGEELNRILHNINTEEPGLDASIDSDSSEYEDQKIVIPKRRISIMETNESVEPTPREQEDPNKKQHDERLAESHRRMLDELALLDQGRKEEEERYAIVLQEQQARLAEEYLRLQKTLDESARQTNNEKLQFETLCREQERLMNDRQDKMAIVIQAWYRGKRVYRQYHGEIIKRVAPTLRSIAKKRKRKEQEDRANSAKLTKIQETNMVEKENKTTSIPSISRISSPLPDVSNKQLNQVQKTQPLPVSELIPSKEDSIKKKKLKQPSTIIPKPNSNSSILQTTQIVQLENPSDFIPTIIPEQRNISSPRKTHVEDNNLINIRRISSPIQTKEHRPKSSTKRQHSAKSEATQIPINTNGLPLTNESISTTRHFNIAPIGSNMAHIPVSRESISRSDIFEKTTENPTPPLTERRSVSRSETFEKKMKSFSSPPPPIESISVTESINTIPSASIIRADTFISKSSTSPPPPIESISSRKSIDIIPTYTENRSNTFINNSESLLSSNERIPVIKSVDTSQNNLPSSLIQSETIPIKPDIPSTPRVSTPRKTRVEEKYPIKPTNSFLNEARQWAKRTLDITYSNLLLATEEAIQQTPIRKTAAAVRKLPDIDPQILTKAAKNQSPKEIHYLLLEHLLTPCSLSLINPTFPNLTHLILRQCKLIQLVGLDSCSSLTILDLENNWLEQAHIQLNHLEYLNLSKNRLTSLLSINTPSLKYLNVSKNRLTRLNGVEKFSNLNILLATSNQLLTTIGLQACTRLLHIDVSDNHLVEMEQLDQCPLLITMKATSNALIQIPNLFNAILLHELDLSSNSLTSFDDLSIGSWLPFLTHLRLSSNSLQELALIKLPALVELELAFNQLSDGLMFKRFIKACPLLSRINLEQNPFLCDTSSAGFIEDKPSTNGLSLLPHSLNEQSSESIELYLNFLANVTSMFITLRQMIEQYQTEPFQLVKSIHNQCQQYYEEKIIEILAEPTVTMKVLSPEEQSTVRLQAHWRRRLFERQLIKKQRAAQKIQAYWRGYAVRQRMRSVRRLFSQQQQQQQQTFDEIDLTEFDFDEAAFDARFQRPRTPATRVRQVWQSQYQVLSKTTTVTDLPPPSSTRSSSAASSRAKPIIEPLVMPSRSDLITNEWGFTPSSSTAALMIKRAERMKWNSERKQKREHMDAYQRLQLARNNEQPPGSLRLARRKASLTNTTKPVVHMKTLSPPSTAQSRPNRVFEWVHTQVARLDDSSVGNTHSPRNERKRLPSLDGSTDSMNRMHSNEILQQQQQQQQQQQRWTSSSVSVRQPPSLLPPITGQLPRL